eukprot:3388019-Amphidinium_carterae.1
MGWTWAAYYAHRAHMHQLKTALTGFNVQFLDGTAPPKHLVKETVAVLPYIDNLTVLGLDK